MVFFFSNYAKIVPYAFLGQLDLTNLATAFVLLPLVPIGVKLGVIIQGKLDEKIFYQVSYWALLGIGRRNCCTTVRWDSYARSGAASVSKKSCATFARLFERPWARMNKH